MSHIRSISKASYRGLRETVTPEGLMGIHESDCASAIWHRQPTRRFQRWIDSIAPDNLPRLRVILRADRVHQAIGHACELAGTPHAPEQEQLVGDIAALSEVFAEIMRVTFVRLRLDVIQTNACRKFHIDAVTARLVCTYRGTGTQLCHEDDPFLTVPTGAPVLVRGTEWPCCPEARVLHRSPPIEGTGETRLVLVLEPVVVREEGHDTIH